MPFYYYQVINADGGIHTGKLDKHSMEEAREALTSLGHIIIELKPLSIWHTDLSDLGFFKQRTGKKDAALFCRQLSFLLVAGVKISKAFELLSAGRKKGSFKRVLTSVRENLQRGESLADSLKKHSEFPPLLTGMVGIGELSGQLPQILSKMADYYEQELKTQEELKSAMIYPAVVSVMMIGVMIAAVVFVIPNYAQVFMSGGVELPFPTLVLIGLSEALRLYYVYIIGVLVSVFIGARVFFKTFRGRILLDYAKFYLPVYGTVYAKMINLRFAQTVSLLLESGQQLVFSLTAVKAVLGSILIDRAVSDMTEKLGEGVPFWKCLEECAYFEPMLCSMAQMGEETGKLAQILAKCGDYFQQETDALIFRLNKLVDPFITIILGLVLAFIMLAVMLPTFALTNVL